MKSILVPTDFSSNAYFAARYAIKLAGDLNAEKLVLYNAYQAYVSEDPEMDGLLLQNIGEFKKISDDGLIKMKETLAGEVPAGIRLEYDSDYSITSNGIVDACKKHEAELIVMGITGTDSKLEEAIIGSTAIDVSKQSDVPVIIVPSDAAYRKFEKILLAIDFKKVAESTPVAAIKKLLDATHAQFDVLHVEASGNKADVNIEKEKIIFESLFNNYHPRYHFLKGENFVDVINDFALSNQSDLIIVIPKKHGFFESIFRRSHTKALAFHSHVPIMSIHE